MTNYRHYEAADFVADASFQAWVQHGSNHEFWTGWQAANPDKASAITTARKLVEALRFHSTEVDPAEMTAVMQNINQALDQTKKNESSARRRLIYIISAAAASLILGILFLWPPSPATVTITTSFAETREVALPDGSRVILNANSRLRYQKSWSASREREVMLNGEAFFKVTSHPSGLHPKFRVHTPMGNVEVMGTAFNVHNRRGAVTVVLEEGKVKMNDLDMVPGDLVTVSATGSERRKVDPAKFLAWKDHRLVFENEPLSSIAAILEDTYGYTVQFRKTAAKDLRLTGTYPGNQIGLLLSAMRAVHGVKIEQRDSTIVIE
ncbi:FecR family protein [Chitinophaga alhagiae]|uniref:FecR family protein n=1 Tax=Chitinophaga alhagiae TaxID=2203219 RepID=UPI0018E51BC0|nr:FecR domain-containing protein [Chitinophaga alhagiae]